MDLKNKIPNKFVDFSFLNKPTSIKRIKEILLNAEWNNFDPENDLIPVRKILFALEKKEGVSDIHSFCTKKLLENSTRLKIPFTSTDKVSWPENWGDKNIVNKINDLLTFENNSPDPENKITEMPLTANKISTKEEEEIVNENNNEETDEIEKSFSDLLAYYFESADLLEPGWETFASEDMRYIIKYQARQGDLGFVEKYNESIHNKYIRTLTLADTSIIFFKRYKSDEANVLLKQATETASCDEIQKYFLHYVNPALAAAYYLAGDNKKSEELLTKNNIKINDPETDVHFENQMELALAYLYMQNEEECRSTLETAAWEKADEESINAYLNDFFQNGSLELITAFLEKKNHPLNDSNTLIDYIIRDTCISKNFSKGLKLIESFNLFNKRYQKKLLEQGLKAGNDKEVIPLIENKIYSANEQTNYEEMLDWTLMLAEHKPDRAKKCCKKLARQGASILNESKRPGLYYKMAQLIVMTNNIATAYEIIDHTPDLKCKISLLAGILECLNHDDTKNIKKYRQIAEELATTADSFELLDINIKLAKAFGKLELNELTDLYFKQATELALGGQVNRNTALDEIIAAYFQVKDYSGARDTFYKFDLQAQIDRTGEFIKKYAVTGDYTTILKLLDKLPCNTIEERPAAIMELIKINTK